MHKEELIRIVSKLENKDELSFKSFKEFINKIEFKGEPIIQLTGDFLVFITFVNGKDELRIISIEDEGRVYAIAKNGVTFDAGVTQSTNELLAKLEQVKEQFSLTYTI